MKTRTRLGAWVAVVAGIMIAGGAGRAWAAPYTWNSTSGGNWDDGTVAGWNTGGAYPNAQDDTATFSQNITSNQTVTINVADARLGTLTLADTTSADYGWTIAGGNPLTFDNGGGAAVINVQASGGGYGYGMSGGGYAYAHVISAPITAAGAVQINLGGRLVLNGNNANLTGGMTISGGSPTNYVRFDSAASLGGGSSPVTVAAGSTALINYDNMSSADLARFSQSAGLLTFFWNILPHTGDPWWATPFSPAANINLTGFNPYFRLGAAMIPFTGNTPPSTISGTFTPAGDTFRFGGGGGSLVVAATLADGSGARSLEAGGPEQCDHWCPSFVALTAVNTYTGPTEVRYGVLRLAGTSGSVLNTAAFNVRPGAFLQLDAGLRIWGWDPPESGSVVGNNNNRVADTTAVNLYGGRLYFFGNPDTGTTETIGPLNARAGLARLDVRWKTGRIDYDPFGGVAYENVGAGTGAAVLTVQSLNLTNGAQLWLRGVNVGVAGSSATRVICSTAPTMVGGGGGDGSTTISIIPGVWKTAGIDISTTPGQNQWVTYDASVGLRALNDGSEYSAFAVGEDSNNNATNALTGASPTLDISSATTVNSLKVAHNASGSPTISGTGPLTLKSGSLLVEHSTEGSGLTLNVPLDFNGNAGQIFWFEQRHSNHRLNSVMSNTGGKGVNLSAFNTGERFEPLEIGGANTYTGPTTINAGYWTTAVASERIPNASDVSVCTGARLTIGSGFAETVASLSGAGTLALGNTSSRMILGSGAGVAGAVTLEGAGAYIAPGDMGAGALTLSGLSATDGLRLRSGELRINLMHAQDYDVLAVGSTKVTISDVGYAGSTLVLNLGNAPSVGDTFKILDVAGATAIVGKFSNGDTLKGSMAGGKQYAFDILYNSALGGGDGNDVVLRCTGRVREGLLFTIR